MERTKLKLGKGEIVLFVVVTTLIWLPAGYCQPNGVALLLQQSPVQGGTISPNLGVHSIAMNSKITLNAVPKSGYQFVYWLGDVADPTSAATTAQIDAPKIIIAVFERAEYAFVDWEQDLDWPPVGGLFAASSDLSSPGGGAPGAKRHSGHGGNGYEPEPEEPDDFPVPGDSDDFPVPVPEPATIILFGIALPLLSRRYRKSG